jgi:hypothetical protein
VRHDRDTAGRAKPDSHRRTTQKDRALSSHGTRHTPPPPAPYRSKPPAAHGGRATRRQAAPRDLSRAHHASTPPCSPVLARHHGMRVQNSNGHPPPPPPPVLRPSLLTFCRCRRRPRSVHPSRPVQPFERFKGGSESERSGPQQQQHSAVLSPPNKLDQ